MKKKQQRVQLHLLTNYDQECYNNLEYCGGVCSVEVCVLRNIGICSVMTEQVLFYSSWSSTVQNLRLSFLLYRFHRYKSTQIGILFVIDTDLICVEYRAERWGNYV